MSETLLAARIVLDGPLPRPPAHGLLSVAQRAPADAHWRAGASLYPYPVKAMPSGQDPLNEGTFREKDDPDGIENPDGFYAWTAYLGEVCTAFSIGNWSEFKGRADVALMAKTSWALERQLVDAEFAPGPHLGDDDVTLLASGAAVGAPTAIAYLEDAIGATGLDGVIHVTPSVVTFCGHDQFRDDRGVLRTTRGTPVIVGTGYVGSDVPTSGGSADTAAGAGQSWCFATGPVMYQFDDTAYSMPESLGEALDRETNEVVYRSERDLWVAWDKQLQVAVLADWSPA